MQQALLFAVRFYEGRYHGIHHGTGDWPPSPARLFQSLAAGSAQGLKVPTKTQKALDWLETLAPPMIAAPHSWLGQKYSNFVPNNDLDSKLPKSGVLDIDEAVSKIRVPKIIQPLLFNEEIPILYYWKFDGDDAQARSLCDSSNNIYQLGRGVDMAWATTVVSSIDEAEQRFFAYRGMIHKPSGEKYSSQNLLCPKKGSRKSLTDRFEAVRHRFQIGKTVHRQVFVQPPKPLFSSIAYDASPRRCDFELCKSDLRQHFSEWPLNKSSELVKTIRDKAAEQLRKAAPNIANDIDKYLIGRGENIDKTRRVHIVPIPSVGSRHADMQIRRIAIYVPQSCPLSMDDLIWAFSKVNWTDNDGKSFRELRLTQEDRMTRRFEKHGKYWQSITPLALPSISREARSKLDSNANKSKNGTYRMNMERQAKASVYNALRHAGIHKNISHIQVQREPFDRNGSHAKMFASNLRFPENSLWHAGIHFTDSIAGPIVLGNGRFLGLGIMRPIDLMHNVLAFSITEGLTDGATPPIIVRAARRAMMSRFQHRYPHSKTIPTYVSGHKADGSPDDNDAHHHISVVADLTHRRILYIPPADARQNSWWRHDQVISALEGMDVLRAGAAGCLKLSPAFLDIDSDPLFSPSRVWESVTNYDVTRHYKNISDDAALKSDVFVELQRHRLTPSQIECIDVLEVFRGPRGGLSGRLRIAFHTAQTGALLLGRTRHKGGGLFTGV